MSLDEESTYAPAICFPTMAAGRYQFLAGKYQKVE